MYDIYKCKKEGKDQQSISSSTTPDPGYQWESDNFAIRHHKVLKIVHCTMIFNTRIDVEYSLSLLLTNEILIYVFKGFHITFHVF